MSIGIWIGALLAYGAFRLWYDGLRGPLTSSEIEAFMAMLKQRTVEEDGQDINAVLHKFMEEDDGKEFIMVNMVQFNPSPVKHPDTGEDIGAPRLLQEYFVPLMKSFIRRAGHPVFSGQVVGGYMDAWNTPEDPGWHVAGLIRYRSRRDAMEATLASSMFDGIHKYKIAAIKQTFAVPTKVVAGGLYASPRVTVGLLLALAAALLQIILAG
ncbi:MAG: hypothetical protein AAGD96_26350 [Chloroflexota bacterium]